MSIVDFIILLTFVFLTISLLYRFVLLLNHASFPHFFFGICTFEDMLNTILMLTLVISLVANC